MPIPSRDRWRRPPAVIARGFESLASLGLIHPRVTSSPMLWFRRNGPENGQARPVTHWPSVPAVDRAHQTYRLACCMLHASCCAATRLARLAIITACMNGRIHRRSLDKFRFWRESGPMGDGVARTVETAARRKCRRGFLSENYKLRFDRLGAS